MTILNRVLPPDIRIVGIAEVSPSFNARFDCLYRIYKYFFVQGEMDIQVVFYSLGRLSGTKFLETFAENKDSNPVFSWQA